MPYYRRRTYRRRTYRRRTGLKRNYRRRFRAPTRYNKRGQKIYLFKRFADYGELTISNVTTTLIGYNFSLDDLPNSSEFTSLYDMYKINCVKLTFLPQQTQSISSGSINNPNASARFFSAIDYNDSNAPASIDELRNYQSCKVTPILRPHKRVIFKPKILVGGVMTSSPWLTTATPSANYFGLKVAVEPMDSTSTTTMMYTVEAKMYMSFKNVK